MAINYGNVIKATDWVRGHKDEVVKSNRSTVVRSIKADTGVDITVHILTQIEKEVGITRARGNAHNFEARKDRVHVVASELIRFMETMGVTPSPELADVKDRR